MHRPIRNGVVKKNPITDSGVQSRKLQVSRRGGCEERFIARENKSEKTLSLSSSFFISLSNLSPFQTICGYGCFRCGTHLVVPPFPQTNSAALQRQEESSGFPYHNNAGGDRSCSPGGLLHGTG